MISGLRIKMSDSFINSILSTVLRREDKSICSVSLEWDSEVHEVNVLECELLHVSDKPIVVVSLGHIVDVSLVVLYR